MVHLDKEVYRRSLRDLARVELRHKVKEAWEFLAASPSSISQWNFVSLLTKLLAVARQVVNYADGPSDDYAQAANTILRAGGKLFLGLRRGEILFPSDALVEEFKESLKAFPEDNDNLSSSI